jgi:glycosyltransferase involved in cell wall biosynthesis
MNSSLRILYITQFFPPEIGAASVRASELAKNWAADGHRVTVLTGFPNYLEGRILDGFRNRILDRRTINGHVLARVYTMPAPKGSILPRLFSQVAFLVFAFLGGMRLGRFDVVIVSSPPFMLVPAGWLISRLRGARFVFEVRDLYPETAIALGVIKNRFLTGFLRRLEAFFYARAHKVVAVTEGIRRYMLNHGVPPRRIIKATNGVNTDQFEFRPASMELRKEWNLDGQFVVQFAGILGLAQGLEVVFSAAQRLASYPQITFVLVGDGVEKPELMERASSMGLNNVIFKGNQALERMPEVISIADIGLALKKKIPLNQGAIPVKMFEYMACGRPVIVGGAEEAETLVRRSDAGLCVDPADPSQLADAVLSLYGDRPLMERCGKNGRTFVEKYYSRREISRNYALALAETIHGSTGGNGAGSPGGGRQEGTS